MILDLLTSDIPEILPFLEKVFQDGGKKQYGLQGPTTPFFNFEGMSGYEYVEDEITGQLAVGIILGGTGYILKRIVRNNGEDLVRFDYYNTDGHCTFTSDQRALQPVIVDFHEIELSCTILNHLYNYLSLEYKNASDGKSQTRMVHSVELFLKRIYQSEKIHLPVKDRVKDPAVTNIFNRILVAEMDPVLNWEERQLVFSNYKKNLKTITDTKIRAHRLNKFSFKLLLVLKGLSTFLARVIARPVSNINGILYRLTIGKVVWFFQTVKNNLGYSVALAVYGPFTYYFITMPMNPHAMQAVGRVREAYLDAKTQIESILTRSEVAIKDIRNTEAIAKTNPKDKEEVQSEVENKDSVSTQNSAPVINNFIAPSAITSGGTSLLNMLLTTDSDQTDKVSWSERMSNFKQVQIAYEENIEYASRMGRLEQLETQYNFPMQVESTWEELERYNNLVFKLREENPNLSAKMKQFLFNEVNRTQQLQLYLWDRMGRFMMDQIYVMLDQDNQQKRNDYYVGRSFIFMEEMTNILSWRYKDLKKPTGYEKIQKLAEFYQKGRKEFGTVMKNLEANSNIFKQKDPLDTKEFRSYMKRQWEILFLQNSKAEEASNMGLNLYIWSVRNTIWILQSIYSAKREELALLIKRDVTDSPLTANEMLSRKKTSMLYEVFFHNLTLEFVGIREELSRRLVKDTEAKQRMTIIENLKEFLADREKLEIVNLPDNQKTAGNSL